MARAHRRRSHAIKPRDVLARIIRFNPFRAHSRYICLSAYLRASFQVSTATLCEAGGAAFESANESRSSKRIIPYRGRSSISPVRMSAATPFRESLAPKMLRNGGSRGPEWTQLSRVASLNAGCETASRHHRFLPFFLSLPGLFSFLRSAGYLRYDAATSSAQRPGIFRNLFAGNRNYRAEMRTR